MTDKIITLLGKWRWPLAIVGTFMLAAGFDFRTPSSQFNELRAQDRVLATVDSAMLDSIAAFRADQRSQDIVITGTGLYRCLHSTTVEQQQLRIKRWCDENLGNR